MNLALHGFLLQVFVSILDFQHGSVLCSAGEPGYLDFDNLPETNFSCQGKVIGGYYADVEAGCQMFHVCTIGQKDEIMDIKFLCLNGTVFDQETRVCERVDEVDCSKSERFYNLNLELYGNNAVTLSLHENNEDQDDPLDSIDDHHQRTTSARPVTTTSTTTTTSKPNKPSTTPASGSYSHPTGYPQHYQPQPPFPQIHTSQSKSLYDDKNGGYHHQYIFHNGERNNNQATSYQLFSNQGVSSTTVQAPQGHQIRFSSTSNPQIIRNEPSTVAPLFHATSSTIQTLLNSNANSPSLINPIFHNHGISSTTEQFSIHSNNPRETSDYRDNGVQNRPLEAVQPTSKGKVSKLTISPVPTQSESSRTVQTKSSQSSESQRISSSFLPTPPTIETTIRSFYPTPRSSTKSTQSSQSSSDQVTHHIHVLPPVPIPQLKPQQITINLPPPDIQRIVQNPSPLLPSQSRVIVTAKASVSDESGRPLNTTQLVTLPLPTIPASYDDYKEGDESFDPFYRDVPKIRNSRRDVKRVSGGAKSIRSRRSLDQTRDSIGPFVSGVDAEEDSKVLDLNDKHQSKEKIADQLKDFKSIKDSLVKFRELLFNKDDDGERNVFENDGDGTERGEKSGKTLGKSAQKILGESLQDTSDKTDEDQRYLEDLETKASKHLKADNYDSEREEESEDEEETRVDSEESAEDDTGILHTNTKTSDVEEYVDDKEDTKIDSVHSEIPTNKATNDDEEIQMRESIDKPSENDESAESDSSDDTKDDTSVSEPERTEANDANETGDDRLIDVVILNPEEYVKLKSSENSTERNANVPTIMPMLSTSEQTVEGVSHDAEKTAEPADTTADAKVGKDSKKADPDEESNKHHGRVGSAHEQSETSSGAAEKEESKERKPGTKRKSSRIRLPKGRISARRRQGKDEVLGGVLRNEETTTDYKTSTTESSTVNFEAEQINSHIFEEPESQTSKEVDTRAVGERNKYPKDLHEAKGQETGKDHRKVEANDYETLEKHPNNLEKHQNKPNEFEPSERKSSPDESTVFKLDNQDNDSARTKSTVLDSLGGPEHSANATKEGTVSLEKKEYYKEETSIEEHESVEDESESISSLINEESKDGSLESSEKKISHETKSSRRGKSMKFEDSRETLSHREDKSMKFDNTEVELESHEYSTIRTKEEINSEEVSSEYHDSTEMSFEDTREISAEADYGESGSLEDTTVSDEHVEYEENVDSREESVEEITENEDVSLIDHEGSTEGVLKFTDELPKDKKEEASEKKSAESLENVAHDYVDDNYEPHNYKEHDPTDSNNLSDEKTKKDATNDDTENKTEYMDKDDAEVTTELPKEESEGKKDVESENEPGKPDDPKEEEKQEEKEEEKRVEVETTTSSTTRRPTTTTLRPTPPKLFKPISARKSYTYVPPTTTPNPVIIKPRFSLLNPKPAKPPKSYNELAPKPVIRKFPLLSRKTTTTTVGTTTIEDKEDVENVTEVPSTTTETSRSEENVLEGKLETKGRVENSEATPPTKTVKSIKNRYDQISSPSEQKAPVNFRKEESDEESKKDTENFTPYPIARFSTLASTIEKTLKEIESTSTEVEKSTTSKPFTFVDVDVISTTVLPPVTTESSKSERNETTNERAMNQEASTASSTKSEYNDATEVTLVSEIPTSMMDPPMATSDPDQLEGMKSTTVRFFNRKSPNAKRPSSFNCLEKEMYRFYGDTRDCRLFHYCSPGFTSRQVLDFRFVCEEGTAFDEESQSCLHDVRNSKCPNRW